jgi:hypothetical protein
VKNAYKALTGKDEEKRILEDFKDREREDLKWAAHVNLVTKVNEGKTN